MAQHQGAYDDIVEDEVDPFEADPDNDGVVRAKWTMDGARTLSEAAARLERQAADLRQMEEDGWQLTGPVEDDYGFIRRAAGADL